MTADLFDDHRQILAMAEALVALARRTPPARIEEIACLRAQLGKRSIAHLHAEDELIMKPLQSSGLAAQLPDAAALIADIRASYGFYSSHASRWTMEAVAQDRAGYANALAGVITHMRAIMSREETVLYRPLLALGQADQVHSTH